MAIPFGALSSVPVVSSLVAPDDRIRETYLQDWERGGIALNDPSQGLNVRDWRAYTDGITVWVAPDPEGAPATAVLTGAGITEVSLAFDQNMQATLAFIEAGTQKLWWYDTLAGVMVVTSFPGARSGMLSMDDKRHGSGAYNDVIFAYIRDGSLRYRQQRDRYGVEYTLGAVAGSRSRLLQFGMGENNRLQFKVSVPLSAAYADLLTDTLYTVSGNELLPMHSGGEDTGIWRSKIIVQDDQPSYGWIKVEGDYPATLRIYGDGVLRYTEPAITSRAPLRLPPGKFRELEVEVESAGAVTAVTLASSMNELKETP